MIFVNVYGGGVGVYNISVQILLFCILWSFLWEFLIKRGLDHMLVYLNNQIF